MGVKLYCYYIPNISWDDLDFGWNNIVFSVLKPQDVAAILEDPPSPSPEVLLEVTTEPEETVAESCEKSSESPSAATPVASPPSELPDNTKEPPAASEERQRYLQARGGRGRRKSLWEGSPLQALYGQVNKEKEDLRKEEEERLKKEEEERKKKEEEERLKREEEEKLKKEEKEKLKKEEEEKLKKEEKERLKKAEEERLKREEEERLKKEEEEKLKKEDDERLKKEEEERLKKEEEERLKKEEEEKLKKEDDERLKKEEEERLKKEEAEGLKKEEERLKREEEKNEEERLEQKEETRNEEEKESHQGEEYAKEEAKQHEEEEKKEEKYEEGEEEKKEELCKEQEENVDDAIKDEKDEAEENHDDKSQETKVLTVENATQEAGQPQESSDSNRGEDHDVPNIRMLKPLVSRTTNSDTMASAQHWEEMPSATDRPFCLDLPSSSVEGDNLLEVGLIRPMSVSPLPPDAPLQAGSTSLVSLSDSGADEGVTNMPFELHSSAEERTLTPTTPTTPGGSHYRHSSSANVIGALAPLVEEGAAGDVTSPVPPPKASSKTLWGRGGALRILYQLSWV